MKIEIEVSEYYKVTYREPYQAYDQRDNDQYTAYRNGEKVFTERLDAAHFARDCVKKKYSNIQIHHIWEFSENSLDPVATLFPLPKVMS